MDKRKIYPVKKIIGVGIIPVEDTWYKVKWEGYKQATWVYDGDCDGCPDRIKEFLDGYNGEPVPLLKFNFHMNQLASAELMDGFASLIFIILAFNNHLTSMGMAIKHEPPGGHDLQNSECLLGPRS
ncbi:hypothetical protein DAPPUDRAFT_247793 [Daphnia pulex]|uniref:Chromo domain-containing protein n=1 Tax=Daphnia pulex TaxID=6669 RepID=E9GTD7_DAPPU|nr:hypothetical protein DAPPUDRAFT_247793 [Daphnia pulex]|eukprot:EFX77260.1 hypothetical protein DAPPUDRAFT_247793 [Daphnia pulex]